MWFLYMVNSRCFVCLLHETLLFPRYSSLLLLLLLYMRQLKNFAPFYCYLQFNSVSWFVACAVNSDITIVIRIGMKMRKEKHIVSCLTCIFIWTWNFVTFMCVCVWYSTSFLLMVCIWNLFSFQLVKSAQIPFTMRMFTLMNSAFR